MADSLIPLIDAHLDLAWNALSFNRDLTLPLNELKTIDAQYTDVPFREACLITLDELSDADLHGHSTCTKWAEYSACDPS